MPVGCNDGPDGAHRLIDPAHRLTIAAFKLAATGPCRIKFGRKPRSIDVEDMNLLARRTAPAGVTESLLQDGIERVERIDHTFDGLIEAARAFLRAAAKSKMAERSLASLLLEQPIPSPEIVISEKTV